MKVTVYGIGYVGLVQGAVLAEVGHDVICVDIDQDKVLQLQAGQCPIYEPGLEDLVRQNIAAGRLRFTTNVTTGVEHAPVQFIAVGTPPDEDGSADLQYVLAVAAGIARHMNDKKIIVNKSTVPVGTADQVHQCISKVLVERSRPDLLIDVVSNPEFLKEGSAVSDCMRPDRIIIGTDNKQSEALMRELYAPFNRNHEKIIVMDVRSAELTKYAANCLLATKISFMNEMANLSERLGADIEMVRHGIGSDPRIGYHFIYPGIGYGGSCFPKDVQALIHTAETLDFEPLVLKAVHARNGIQKRDLYHKVFEHYSGCLEGVTFALWGLAFKPNTDDMRDAPSRVLIELLISRGARIRAYDPQAIQEARRIYGQQKDLTLCTSKEDALKGASALIIATEWQEFKAPDFGLIGKELDNKVIFDGRNLFDPKSIHAHGITYYSIGRQSPDSAK